MVASISNAVAAYANAGKIAGPGLAARDGGSFADLLKQAGGDAMGALKIAPTEQDARSGG